MPKKKNTKKSETKPSPSKGDVREYFLENGWRLTLGKFKLSPPQASKIIDAKLRAKRKEIAKAAKKAEGASTKVAKKKAPKKVSKKSPKKSSKKSAKEKVAKKTSGKKRGRPPKEKTAAKAPARRGRPPKKKAAMKAPSRRVSVSVKADVLEATLDYLIGIRKKNQYTTLDDAIFGLVEQSRAA